MADNYLITGYHGAPHVTAENDRGINAAMFGTGRFVLPVGEQFRAEYIGNNTVRVYDGKLVNNGAVAGIPAGEYVDLPIVNASQGMKRNDLIVFQYQQDTSTQIESGTFVVVQGTEASGTASAPALTQNDLLTNKATFDQMALWRIPVSGGTISAPVKVFSVYENSPAHKQDKKNPHAVTAAQIGLGNVNNTSDANKPVSTAQAAAIADAKKAGTDAQTLANNAKTAANKAQTTADNAQTAADNAQTAANNAQATADRMLPLDGSAPMTGMLTVPALILKTLSGITRTIRWLDADGKQLSTIGISDNGNRLLIRQYNLETGKNEYYTLPEVTDGLSANTNYQILTSKEPVTVAQGGTGAKTADEARTNLGMGVELWKGSWANGSITVPDTSKYRMFMITMSGQGTCIPVFRMENHVRGIGGYYDTKDARTETYQFTATIEGNAWILDACNSGAIGSNPTSRTVSKIWGLL